MHYVQCYIAIHTAINDCLVNYFFVLITFFMCQRGISNLSFLNLEKKSACLGFIFRTMYILKICTIFGKIQVISELTVLLNL